MSNFLSRAVKGVRKALHLPPITLGNVATKYAPAAIMAATGNPGGAVATVYGAPSVPAGQRRPIQIPSFASGSTFPDPTNTPAPAAGADESWWQKALGGLGDLAGDVGSYVKDNPGNVALGGLAAYQAANSAKASARAGKMQDAAIAQAKERWAEGAPLRAEASRRLLNPAKHDLTAVYNDPFNAFSRPATATPTRPAVPTPTPVPSVPTGPIASAPGFPTNRLPANSGGLGGSGIASTLRRVRSLKLPTAV